jgi:hypothetical protein
MNDAPRPMGESIPLPGSPLAEYEARINTDLAAGFIPATCPHPAAVTRLYLPSATLCCEHCEAETRAAVDSRAPVCAICGAPAAGSTAWLAVRVVAVALLCRRCQTTGNVPQAVN